MNITFLELRHKEVIEAESGKRLGRVIDLVFSYPHGKVLGIIVPGEKAGFFKPCEDVFIKFKNICKIGDDVILVTLQDKEDDCDDKKGRCDERRNCNDRCGDNRRRNNCDNVCNDKRRHDDCDGDE